MDRDGRQRGRGRKGGATQHAHGQQYCSPEYAEGDFKEEEPDKYQAFVAKAISWNGFVASVSLGKRMCVDRHVPDLLPCLDSWLRSELHRPYNLGTFDLSNNALSDDSIKKIFIALRNLDVSVHELNLDHNRLTEHCLGEIARYMRSAPDPLATLRMNYNDVADSTEFTEFMSFIGGKERRPIHRNQKLVAFDFLIEGNRLRDTSGVLATLEERLGPVIGLGEPGDERKGVRVQLRIRGQRTSSPDHKAKVNPRKRVAPHRAEDKHRGKELRHDNTDETTSREGHVRTSKSRRAHDTSTQLNGSTIFRAAAPATASTRRDTYKASHAKDASAPRQQFKSNGAYYDKECSDAGDAGAPSRSARGRVDDSRCTAWRVDGERLKDERGGGGYSYGGSKSSKSYLGERGGVVDGRSDGQNCPRYRSGDDGQYSGDNLGSTQWRYPQASRDYERGDRHNSEVTLDRQKQRGAQSGGRGEDRRLDDARRDRGTDDARCDRGTDDQRRERGMDDQRRDRNVEDQRRDRNVDSQRRDRNVDDQRRDRNVDGQRCDRAMDDGRRERGTDDQRHNRVLDDQRRDCNIDDQHRDFGPEDQHRDRTGDTATRRGVRRGERIKPAADEVLDLKIPSEKEFITLCMDHFQQLQNVALYPAGVQRLFAEFVYSVFTTTQRRNVVVRELSPFFQEKTEHLLNLVVSQLTAS
eukprot:GEMP01032852.1.p1 GENE.GEMP01032852.1~~GEMP01032852.1.p1  ORF type:complete len:695 (+),score=163.55 GEMP01032852.1:36-2120(+)